jgi:hypothetical protein
MFEELSISSEKFRTTVSILELSLLFQNYIDKHYHFSLEEKKKALFYIGVHVADETQVAHFQVVVKALNEYSKATNFAAHVVLLD